MVVRSAQLPSVARAAADLPSSVFVLDHLGKPAVAAGDWRAWRELIAPVAALPNVVAKVSGLVAEADWKAWTAADLRPFVHIAVELFGTSRLMYGSDWPVLEVAATYAQVKDVMADLLGGLLPDVFGGTAIRTYHRGSALRHLLDHLDDPPLALVTGEVGGSGAPGTARCAVIGVSPLSGAVAETRAEGPFAAGLRAAGGTGIVVPGRASRRDRRCGTLGALFASSVTTVTKAGRAPLTDSVLMELRRDTATRTNTASGRSRLPRLGLG